MKVIENKFLDYCESKDVEIISIFLNSISEFFYFERKNSRKNTEYNIKL